jgi:hypothetical protein
LNGAPYPANTVAEYVNTAVNKLPAELKTAMRVRWLYKGRLKQKAKALGISYHQFRWRLERSERLVGERLEG